MQHAAVSSVLSVLVTIPHCHWAGARVQGCLITIVINLTSRGAAQSQSHSPVLYNPRPGSLCPHYYLIEFQGSSGRWMFNNAASRDENTRIISAHIHDHQQYTAAQYNAPCMRLVARTAEPGLDDHRLHRRFLFRVLGHYTDTICLFFANSSTILSPLTTKFEVLKQKRL